jgi:hypothetical protein
MPATFSNILIERKSELIILNQAEVNKDQGRAIATELLQVGDSIIRILIESAAGNAVDIV